jgi:hypothetical protein
VINQHSRWNDSKDQPHHLHSQMANILMACPQVDIHNVCVWSPCKDCALTQMVAFIDGETECGLVDVDEDESESGSTGHESSGVVHSSRCAHPPLISSCCF